MVEKRILVKVVKGCYAGRVGFATEPNKLGLVMFYPIEGKHPYRVCLSKNDIDFI